MRVDEILPRLFISARTHQLSDTEKLMLVQKYQLTVVVNLWHTPDTVVRDAVETYIHCSIPDGKRIYYGLVDLGKCVAGIYNNNSDRILVHCYGGRNRAVLLSGLIVHLVLGISGDDLVSFLRQRRRGALKNVVFANWLKEYSMRKEGDDHQFAGNFGIR